MNIWGNFSLNILPAGQECGSGDKEGVLTQRVIIVRRGESVLKLRSQFKTFLVQTRFFMIIHQSKSLIFNTRLYMARGAVGHVTPDIRQHFLAV